MSRLRPPRHAIEECHLPPFRAVPLPDRQRMVELLERLDRDTRQPGQSCGWVGGPRAVAAFRAIVIDLYRDGLRLTQDEIRTSAGISLPVLKSKLAILAELGLLPYSRVYRPGGFPRRWGANAFFLPTLRAFERLCEFTRRTADSISQERVLFGWPPTPDDEAVDGPAPEPSAEEADLARDLVESTRLFLAQVERRDAVAATTEADEQPLLPPGEAGVADRVAQHGQHPVVPAIEDAHGGSNQVFGLDRKPIPVDDFPEVVRLHPPPPWRRPGHLSPAAVAALRRGDLYYRPEAPGWRSVPPDQPDAEKLR